MQYEKLTVEKLKIHLTQRGLDTKGRKADLINRLIQNDTLLDSPDGISNNNLKGASLPCSTDQQSCTSIVSHSLSRTHDVEPKAAVVETQNNIVGLPNLDDLTQLTEAERLARRREKFGVFSLEDEATKKFERAKRFSLTTAETEAVKMQHRAERFGTLSENNKGITPLLVDIDEVERRKKRANRFGTLSLQDEERKKQARKERFGFVDTSTSTFPVETVGIQSFEAKLAARVLRFGKSKT